MTRSSRAPGVWEWLQIALLAVNLAWTTLCLGGFLAETMIVTSLLNGLLLGIHLVSQLGPGRTSAHPAGWWLLPFLIYAAVNAAWITPVAWLGWNDWLEWAQLSAVFWVVLNGVRSAVGRRVLLGLLLFLAAAEVALAGYQRYANPEWLMLGRLQALHFIGRGSGSFGIPNSLAGFLILLLPAAAALAVPPRIPAARRVFFGGLTLCLAFGLFLTISRGGWISLGLALAACPFFISRWRWALRLAGAVAVVGLVTAIGAVLYSAVPEVKIRLTRLALDSGERSRPIIWRGAWAIFREHPTFGSGAGSFNVSFDQYRPEYFQDEPVWAHNEYLNTLSDYGLVGFLFFFGACGVLVWRGSRSRSGAVNPDPTFPTGALAVGGLGFALHIFVDFHLKIPALAMALATVSALILQQRWPVEERPAEGNQARRWLAGGALLLVFGVTYFLAWPHYRGEAARFEMRRAIDRLGKAPATEDAERELLIRARRDFARATQLDSRNAQAWSDRAYVDTLWSLHETDRNVELGREAERFARRAVEGSKVVPEFWLRLGVACDLQGKWGEGGDSFAEALRLAPTRGFVWFFYANHLALNPVMTPLAVSAVATSLRLDPGNREAEALQQRLVSRH